jgi:PEGA domain-containing protein
MIAENPNNPNNLVAGGLYQYLSSFNSTGYYNTGVSGVFTSWDGGRTWADRTLPTNPQWFNTSSAVCNQLHLADTAIGFGPNNTVYYVDLTDSIGDQVCTAPTTSLALYVTISTDGGNSWGTPTGIAGTTAGGFMDKPWIAIDQTTGEVYVAYNDDSNGTITLRNSTDSGKTWGTPVNLTSTSTGAIGVELVVDPWGGVDATWYDGGPMFSRSTDHGAHFSTPKLLATAVSGASPTPDTFRAFTLPGLGVDGYVGTAYAGRLYSIWQNGSGGAAGTPVVSMTYSSDNGTTWSSPATINSNLTQESYQPDIAVGLDGTVYAEWYGERFSDGHYRLYGAESHNGGATFDRQFAISNNDSVPIYPTGGSAGWWIGDYTHIMADRLGARPLWTDARSPLSWLCSPCLWGVNYNITFYTGELTNASIGANVPVNLTLNGTVPFPGNVPAGGSLVGEDALVGDTVNLTAPAQVLVSGSPWYFSVWYGSVDSTNRTLNTSVHGADRWIACYVPAPGGRCHAAGAPGDLVVNVHPIGATLKVDHVTTPTVAGSVDLLEAPGAFQVQAWAVGHWPASVFANVTPGNVTYVNLTLAPVPGTLAGFVSPAGASVRLNTTTLPIALNGSFSVATIPGSYTLTASLFGYAPYVNRSVGIQFNQTTFVPITLAPLPGWINGTVAPGNASVTVNGVVVNLTNGTFSVQEGLGTYWVNATAPGFYPSASGPLTMGPFGRLNANLSLVLIVGTLAGTVDPVTAMVLVNGQSVNVTGGAFTVSLPPGTYSIDVSAHQYIPGTTKATVHANKSTNVTLALRLSPGWIQGSVAPSNATISLDGTPVVVSNSGEFNVTAKAGSHLLNATVPGYGESDKTIVVIAAATTHTSFDLSPLASSSTLLTATTIGFVALVAVVIAAAVGVWLWRRRRPPR